jgi:hypothetical protein
MSASGELRCEALKITTSGDAHHPDRAVVLDEDVELAICGREAAIETAKRGLPLRGQAEESLVVAST